MQWQDQAIILSVKKFSERDGIVTVFSREHGCYRSIAKGALGSTQRGIYQSGNIVQANWNARLSEHMGTLKAEMMVPITACVLPEQAALSALQSICAMLDKLLQERDPHPQLFDVTRSTLLALARGSDWQEAYVNFELELLKEMGFGLDLSRCASTGSREELIYVSPKSGRAVSRMAGEPYHDKMLNLPRFLSERVNRVEVHDLFAGLKLTGHFLAEWVFSPHGWNIPAARDRLVSVLEGKSYALPVTGYEMMGELESA